MYKSHPLSKQWEANCTISTRLMKSEVSRESKSLKTGKEKRRKNLELRGRAPQAKCHKNDSPVPAATPPSRQQKLQTMRMR